MKSLRQSIGIVQQDVYLFSGTIRDNIAYGRPDATEDEIKEAANMAGANEFISLLPKGMDTYIGERGVKLSGGQKQRISIARVFLKNPKILILDEATSSIDTETEILLQRGLQEMLKGRTSFIIAHRLSTIKNSTCIMYVDQGQILEKGSHDELLKIPDGYYHNLYDSQYAFLNA